MWAKDPSLFGLTAPFMFDWLNEPQKMLATLESLLKVKDKIKLKKYRYIVLLGMGGSSLSVKVLQEIFAQGTASHFFVLDTLHPDAVERVLEKISLASTLFIVASKSGTTLEPNLLYRFFLKELKQLHPDTAYDHFVAITDPSTPLYHEADQHNFLAIVKGNPLIGGRYSALSPFGMLPALLMNIDAQQLLEKSLFMSHQCGPSVLPEKNPGAFLGLFMGINKLQGRDKLVLHFSPSLAPFGMWLEQLIAESLGKNGNGIVPIVHYSEELLHNPTTQHCSIELKNDPISNELKAALHDAQKPIIQIDVDTLTAIGAEMFRWQIAVATSASVLKINPFDQPDVEHSKLMAQQVLKSMTEGTLKNFQTPSFSSDALDIFATDSIETFFAAWQKEDYCAVLSYLDETDDCQDFLKTITKTLTKSGLPILTQSGPRYLHSTGQLFKGGKNNGHFILLTGTYHNKTINDNGVSFDQIHLSQALGDYQALQEKGRHVLHIHIKDIPKGCQELVALCTRTMRILCN